MKSLSPSPAIVQSFAPFLTSPILLSEIDPRRLNASEAPCASPEDACPRWTRAEMPCMMTGGRAGSLAQSKGRAEGREGEDVLANLQRIQISTHSITLPRSLSSCSRDPGRRMERSHSRQISTFEGSPKRVVSSKVPRGIRRFFSSVMKGEGFRWATEGRGKGKETNNGRGRRKA